MAMPPFAFSVHNFISSTGADAGFAAIVGLAILILLYFAHARETANLRDEAELLTQRLQHAEARVAALLRMQAAESTAQPPPIAVVQYAPAGTAAPALGSATRVIPLEVRVPEPEEPIVVQRPVAAPVPAMAMAGVTASAVAAAPPPAPPPQPPAALPQAPDAPSEQPGRSVPRGVPAPSTVAGGNGAGHTADRPSPPIASGTVRRQPPARSLPPYKLSAPKRRHSRLGRGIAVAVVALAAVAVAVVLFALTSIGGSSTPTTAGQTTNAPAGHGAAGGFKPSSITVAVLNGTSVNQLAHRISAKLAALGYKQGTIATAANQTETKTTVAYVRGARNRAGADRVATALGLRRSAVQQVDQSTLQVACPGPSSCTADVVVTVGQDLSSQ